MVSNITLADTLDIVLYFLSKEMGTRMYSRDFENEE
jgi:hypothetical protein